MNDTTGMKGETTMNVREGRMMKQTGWAIAALFGVSLMGAPGVWAAGHATNRTSPPAQSTTEIACCVPDDEGVECETGTADECAAAQGVNLGAVACDPNPCPPPAPEIACCVPDDEEVECEEETADECTADGGTSLGAGTCDPNPCVSPPPPGDIQCCRTDDGETECEEETADECTADGGTNLGAGTCDPNPCTS